MSVFIFILIVAREGSPTAYWEFGCNGSWDICVFDTGWWLGAFNRQWRSVTAMFEACYCSQVFRCDLFDGDFRWLVLRVTPLNYWSKKLLTETRKQVMRKLIKWQLHIFKYLSRKFRNGYHFKSSMRKSRDRLSGRQIFETFLNLPWFGCSGLCL